MCATKCALIRTDMFATKCALIRMAMCASKRTFAELSRASELIRAERLLYITRLRLYSRPGSVLKS